MVISEYVVLFFTIITISMIVYLPISFILKKKNIGIIRQASGIMLYFSLFLVVFATIIMFNFPFDFNSDVRFLNLQPFLWLCEGNIASRIINEIRPNIMIFIPFGFFIPVVFRCMRKFLKTSLIVFILTFCIEFLQYFIGRTSDIDDLITNLSGGMIGYGLFKITERLFKNSVWWQEFTGADRTKKRTGA